MSRSRHPENHGTAERISEEKKLTNAWLILNALIQNSRLEVGIPGPRGLPERLTALAGNLHFSETQRKAAARFIAKKRFQPGFRPENFKNPNFLKEFQEFLRAHEGATEGDLESLEAFIVSSRSVISSTFEQSSGELVLRDEIVEALGQSDLNPKVIRYWQNFVQTITPENLKHDFPSQEEFLEKSDQILRRRSKRKEEVTQPTARAIARERADTQPPPRSDPDHEVTHPTAPPVKKVRIKEMPQEAGKLLKEADKHMRNKKYIKAIELVRKAMEKDVRAGAYLRKYYELMIKTDDGGEALWLVVGGDKNEALARLFYGHFLHRRMKSGEDLEKVMEIYKAAIERDEKLADEVVRAFIKSAESSWNDRRHIEAVGHIKKGLSINPESNVAKEFLTDCYERLKKVTEGGFEDLQAIIKIEPNDALAHCVLGEIYIENNATDQAMRHIEKALRLNPDLKTRIATVLTAKMAEEKHQLAKLQKEKKKKTTAARKQAYEDSIASLKQLGQNVAKIVQPRVAIEETGPITAAPSEEPSDSRLREISEDEAEGDIEMPIHKISPEMSAQLARGDEPKAQAPQKAGWEGDLPSVIIDQSFLEAKSGEAEWSGRPDEDTGGEDFDDPTDAMGEAVMPDDDWEEKTDPSGDMPLNEAELKYWVELGDPDEIRSLLEKKLKYHDPRLKEKTYRPRLNADYAKLEGMVAQAPHDPDVAEKLRKLNKKIAFAEDIIASAVKYREVFIRCRLGYRFLKRGQFGKALNQFQLACELEPDLKTLLKKHIARQPESSRGAEETNVDPVALRFTTPKDSPSALKGDNSEPGPVPASEAETRQKIKEIFVEITFNEADTLETRIALRKAASDYMVHADKFPKIDFKHREFAKKLRPHVVGGAVDKKPLVFAHRKDVELNKKDYRAYAEAGYSYFELNTEEDLRNAMKCFVKALRLEPTPGAAYGNIHKMLNDCQVRIGKLEQNKK